MAEVINQIVTTSLPAQMLKACFKAKPAWTGRAMLLMVPQWWVTTTVQAVAVILPHGALPTHQEAVVLKTYVAPAETACSTALQPNKRNGEYEMNLPFFNRRSFLSNASLGTAALIASPTMLLSTAQAQSFAPTKTMRGGSNNYSPNAPMVEKLGSGFIMSGMVLRAGTGEPLSGIRIQIWAATTLGGEREPRNHGSVLTRADGSYELEMEQIVPNFGQPHAHLAYDDEDYQTVFLRPVMPNSSDTALQANFNLVSA